jgi:hypothetical protein
MGKREGIDMQPVVNGQPLPVNSAGELYISCCDCSLCHLLKITTNGKEIFVTVYRDDFLTEQARKPKPRKSRKPKKGTRKVENLFGAEKDMKGAALTC